MNELNDIIKPFDWEKKISKSLEINPQISKMLKSQERVMKQLSDLNMASKLSYPGLDAINKIFKSYNFPQNNLIPKTTIQAFASITKHQEQYLNSFKPIAELMKTHSSAFAQINSLNFALKGISAQIATIASQQERWNLIDDFEEVTEQTIEFAEKLDRKLTEEQKREFQVLLDLVFVFIKKHKTLGVFSLLIIDIFLRFAGFHQYYDFLKEKPNLATKEDIKSLNIKQDSSIYFIKEISKQLKEVKEFRITNRECLVKLKPKKRTSKLTKLPLGFEVILIQVHHKWVYVSYFNPEDNLPQTGWIMKKYLNKPK
ncbi:hypothetical protein [Tenacibaculum insulae]|uniref:hypothetical protein n=1 Tax=Tenacibaculum insulae TaxID=2029677 RepID=UPI003AB34101